METIQLLPYSESLRPAILAVWERAVLATHDFLSQPDFEAIKKEVLAINFQDFEVFCLLKGGTVVGFVGIADRKIEMLFVDPAHTRQGFGAQLLDFAVTACHADRLDVNAQNKGALAFYQAQGFEKYAWTELDDQGRSYPLWRMRLGRLER